MDFDKVRELRNRSQASMSACKRTLEQCKGDVEAAMTALQKSGEAKASAMGGRTAAEGRVYTYRHPGDRLAVVVEVNCQTDFCARSEAFGALCEEVAMQVAGMGARYVRREDIPDRVMADQDVIFTGQAAAASPDAPEERLKRISSGKVEKWAKEACLLEQQLISDPSKTVGQRVLELSAKTGEKIEVRRFVRWELAEGLVRPVEDYAEEVAKVASGTP